MSAEIDEFIQENQGRLLDELKEFLRIPRFSPGPCRCGAGGPRRNHQDGGAFPRTIRRVMWQMASPGAPS
jgi:hypothetical protein